MMNPFAFPSSNLEAFLRNYDIQHGEPNSSLDHKEDLENMLCMLSLQTIIYCTFGEEEHRFHKRNKTS